MEMINVEEVKKYNARLKKAQDMSAQLNAELKYNKENLETLCKQLSAEIGKEVTLANIEQIYNERVEAINNTMQVGNEILNRVENESIGNVNTYATQQAQVSQQPFVAQQTVTQQPFVAPVQQTVQAPQGGFNLNDVQGFKLGEQANQAPQAPQGGFNLNDVQGIQIGKIGELVEDDDDDVPPTVNVGNIFGMNTEI